MRNARIFIEKKYGFRVEADSLKNTLNQNLNLNIEELRLLKVYDIFNIEDELLEKAKNVVFSEPVTDDVFEDVKPNCNFQFAVEFLPGQFDQRADSAKQCLKLLNPTSIAEIKKILHKRSRSPRKRYVKIGAFGKS